MPELILFWNCESLPQGWTNFPLTMVSFKLNFKKIWVLLIYSQRCHCPSDNGVHASVCVYVYKHVHVSASMCMYVCVPGCCGISAAGLCQYVMWNLMIWRCASNHCLVTIIMRDYTSAVSPQIQPLSMSQLSNCVLMTVTLSYHLKMFFF